jgi:hypothetical protein
MNIFKAGLRCLVAGLLLSVNTSNASDFTLLYKVTGSFSESTGVDSANRYYKAYSIQLDPQYMYSFQMSLPPNERASFFVTLRLLDQNGKCVGRAGSSLKFWPEKEGKYFVVICVSQATTFGKFVLSTKIKPATDYVFEESWRVTQRIDELDVVQNPDYQPGGGKTYCNKFAADLVQKVGASLPKELTFDGTTRRWLSNYYNAREQNEKRGTTFELNANMMQDWLADSSNGWEEISGHEPAQRFANRGYLVLASWKNPTSAWKSGHITIVRAYEWDGFNSDKGPRIAQAGRTNFSDDFASSGFSASKRSQVRYFLFRHQLNTWVPKADEVDVDIPGIKAGSFSDAEHEARNGKATAKTPGKPTPVKTPIAVTTSMKVVQNSNLEKIRARLHQLRGVGRKTSGMTPVGDSWLATTENTVANAEQQLVESSSFEALLEKLAPMRKNNWAIVDIDFNGKIWVATMEKKANAPLQRIISGTSVSQITDKIKSAWKVDQRVTSITHGKNNWIAVVTKSSNLKTQAYSVKKDWSKIEPWIKSQWKKERDITSAAYHNGTWVIIMTQTDETKSQRWIKRKSSLDLTNELEEELPKGFEVDLIVGNRSEWIAVLSRTKD